MSAEHDSFEDLASAARVKLAEIAPRISDLKPKDRMAIPPQAMPAQDPDERRRNISEVALGYTLEQARVEAARCLDCKNKPCVDGAPLG